MEQGFGQAKVLPVARLAVDSIEQRPETRNVFEALYEVWTAKLDDVKVMPRQQRGQLLWIVATLVTDNHIKLAEPVFAQGNGEEEMPTVFQHPCDLCESIFIALDVFQDLPGNDQVEGSLFQGEVLSRSCTGIQAVRSQIGHSDCTQVEEYAALMGKLGIVSATYLQTSLALKAFDNFPGRPDVRFLQGGVFPNLIISFLGGFYSHAAAL